MPLCVWGLWKRQKILKWMFYTIWGKGLAALFFQIVATLLWSALWIKIFWIFCTSSLFVLWNVLFFCPTAKIVWNYQILKLGAERLIISWNVEGSSSFTSWMTNLWRVQYEKVKGIFVNSYPGSYLQIIWRTVIISALLLYSTSLRKAYLTLLSSQFALHDEFKGPFPPFGKIVWDFHNRTLVIAEPQEDFRKSLVPVGIPKT